jgi:hypothetical protein
VWSGAAGIGLLFVGLIVAGWFPPPSPHATAREVAHMYQTHTNRIRIAALLIACAGALTAPYVAAISTQMKRIEGSSHPLTYLQLGCGMVGVLLVTIPTFFWQAAAYDPHRSSEITQALHVAGWLPFIAAIFPAIVQNFSIAGAILTDKRAAPIFPRWLAYANIWIATLFVPSGLVLFFHHGPFSWNGIFTFWLAATVFGAWFIAMIVCLLKAIAQQEAEAPAGAGVSLPEAETVAA